MSCSGSISNSTGEERAYFSAIVFVLLCGFCSEGFPLPLGAWDGLRYFIYLFIFIQFNVPFKIISLISRRANQ